MAKIYYNDNGTWKVVDISGGGGGGGSIDANTLNGLLKAGDGISIGKTTAGDKVEVKVDSSKVITAIGLATYDSMGQQSYLYPDNLQYRDYEGNQYMLAFPLENGTLTTDGSFKTLFGDKSIVGSGNIDLYRHIVELNINTGNGVTAYAVIISSKNLPIGSLADLKTVLGNTFNYPIQGFGQTDSSEGIIAYLMTDQSVYCNTSYTAIPVSWANVTISDTVTTI